MPQLSIIVPIFNVEKYLERCLDSILKQTFKDFELILINDGSTDNCAQIMEKYAKADGRIIAIHQNNKGVSAARNKGLSIATGIYVGFVDPDDWIENNMYEELIRRMNHGKYDLVCCNWCDNYANGNRCLHEINNVQYKMSRDEFIQHVFDKPRSLLGSNCNKLFVREKIKYYYDENIRIGEDTLFLIQYSIGIESVSFINRFLYNIFVRDTSAIRKNPARLVEGLEALEKVLFVVSKYCPQNNEYVEEEYLDACYRLFFMLKGTDETEYYMCAKKRFENYVKRNFIKIIKNKKIYWKTKFLYLKTILQIK